MTNAWIHHVKSYAAQNNLPFSKALKDAKCKEHYHSTTKGGALDAPDLQSMLSNSYKQPTDVNGFQLDKDLSGKRVQVYHNPNTKQSVTVHRGTQGFQDVLTDVQLALGMKNNKRWKHAQDVQNKAEQKYGQSNMTTIGHSLGSAIAEKVGKNSKEVITYNKPTVPSDFNKKVSNKQTDIRTSRDLVSILKPYRKGTNDITIQSKSWNPLKEHSTKELKKLGQRTIVG